MGQGASRDKDGEPSVSVPSKMKRLVLAKPGNDVESCKFEVQECDVPRMLPGEVLIKVAAAPINPSDVRLSFVSIFKVFWSLAFFLWFLFFLT